MSLPPRADVRPGSISLIPKCWGFEGAGSLHKKVPRRAAGKLNQRAYQFDIASQFLVRSWHALVLPEELSAPTLLAHWEGEVGIYAPSNVAPL
jgi:hypothetical protein